MSGKEIQSATFAGEAPVDEKITNSPTFSKEKQSDFSSIHSALRDDIPEGTIFPTREEREGPNALRRVSDKVPWNAYLIGIVEMAERFSYYGTTAVFVNFIQRPLPPGSTTGAGGKNGVSGALGLGQQASQGLTTFNSFWVYVIPLFGAYIADTRLGRFKTICYSVAIAIVGHILMIFTSIPSVIVHPHSSVALFSIALIIMGIGTGGFKANISPLVAEQYRIDYMRVETLPSGERIIVDPALTYTRIYLYFYMLINVGALVGQIGMTYAEKYVGFWLSYTLPTAFFLLSPLILYLGRNSYILSPPQGSIVGDALRVWRTALQGTWSWNPVKTYKLWDAPNFWDRAYRSEVAKRNGGIVPSWIKFDDVFVDEVKRGAKACQVFAFFPLYWIAYNQLNNNLTSQAATMTTHGVPNDVINNLDPLALIILIPICDRFIYPALYRMGFNFSPIKRIAFGFGTGTLAMIWSAVVQHYVYKTSPCGNHASGADCKPSPLNVWIQSGSYILIALSEIFASVTGLEYAFTKAPKGMRSFVVAIFWFTSALASAICEAMNPLSADPNLVWNYVTSGIISSVAGILFWIFFRHLDKQEDELNMIGNPHGEDEHERERER